MKQAPKKYALVLRAAVVLLWGGVVLWKFLAWRSGEASYEDFLTSAGMFAMLLLFAVVLPLTSHWRARRHEQLAVSRSTIQD